MAQILKSFVQGCDVAEIELTGCDSTVNNGNENTGEVKTRCKLKDVNVCTLYTNGHVHSHASAAHRKQWKEIINNETHQC